MEAGDPGKAWESLETWEPGNRDQLYRLMWGNRGSSETAGEANCDEKVKMVKRSCEMFQSESVGDANW
jgi:hypothetical protein